MRLYPMPARTKRIECREPSAEGEALGSAEATNEVRSQVAPPEQGDGSPVTRRNLTFDDSEMVRCSAVTKVLGI
jgi:hypothetical protein